MNKIYQLSLLIFAIYMRLNLSAFTSNYAENIIYSIDEYLL